MTNSTQNNHAANLEKLQSDPRLATGYYFLLETAYRRWNASEYTLMPFAEFISKLERGELPPMPVGYGLVGQGVVGTNVILDTDLIKAAAAVDYLESVPRDS